MVETRLQEKRSLADIVEDLRLRQEQHSDELKGHVESLDARFSKLESFLFTHLSNGSTQPQQHQESSSTPSAMLFSPSSSRPPDPPDRPGYDQIRTERGPPEAPRPPLLPSSLSSRLTKVGFPMFNGSKLREWIYRCDQFFGLDNTPMEQRVPLASMHLEDEALEWHHNLIAERYGILPSWSDYVVEISSRFSGIINDPLSELVSLKQGNDPIEVYLKKFESARTRVTLTAAHALSIFLTNMQPHLSLHVRQFTVTTIAEAARIAKLHEAALAQTPQRLLRAPFNPLVNAKHSGPSFSKGPSSSPLLSPPDVSHPPKPSFIPRSLADKTPRKFTYQEMQDRRAQGLCMFCDEAFTPGHQLKHKRSQIYVLECDDDDDAADVVLFPEP
ncbi:unnamed protein product [Thlaspi arvense]|uniref:Retrotransposon gag domain-containing protein n=1 Tax=Thlaspi arvense TaxID=13288 RepID=A0AAU9RU33_THLAR|nr:unnamed protein product [Thlaspi arvense]